jgi:hypothetical protein
MPTSTYDLIESKTLSSNTTTVTFTSIPSTYTHLLLKLSTRDGSYNSLNSSMYIRFNGDTTGGNYANTAYGYGNQTTSGGTIAGAISPQPGFFYGQMPGLSNASNMWCNSYVVIPNYTKGTAKTANSLSTNMTQGTDGPWQTFSSGRWSGTAAINEVNLISDGNYASGSFIQLYGISN